MGNFREKKLAGPAEMDPLEKAIEGVRKTLDALRGEGYEFECVETPGEFILKFAHPPKETHFTKMDPFPLQHNGEIKPVFLKDAIRARVINPDGNLYDTMHSEKFRNKLAGGKLHPHPQ